MDDISPLRQWGAQTSELQLFKPNDALRGLDRTLGDRLHAEAAGAKVTLDFLDAKAT